MPKQIERCRICGSEHLELVLDLGEQALTGVFPRSRDQQVTAGPLRLVKCQGENSCGLLQLQHSYDGAEMYGENYGYRSGLNASMVKHLNAKIAKIMADYSPQPGSLIIDIGSNDSTTLQAYPAEGLTLVGIDPTGSKFREYYPPHIELVPDFFSAEVFRQHYPGREAQVVTSFSMFYDLEDPMGFMAQVHEILADGGIWVFEQSYMPTMLAMNSYDTVCHEHIEYYAMQQIAWMAERVGFSLLDVELNDVNGGSFSIVARKTAEVAHGEPVLSMLAQEERDGLHGLAPYRAFADRVSASREALKAFLSQAASEGKRICALGASTKGNVVLQYCDIDPAQLECVGEVNDEKFGSFTPGTLIPIIPEREVLEAGYDYHLVLPWHFRAFFDSAAHLKDARLVYPLPEIEVLEPR